MQKGAPPLLVARPVHPGRADVAAPAANRHSLKRAADRAKRPPKGRPIALHA
jgi:hypothetical protein